MVKPSNGPQSVNPTLVSEPYPPYARYGIVPPLWMPWYDIGFTRAVARFWRKAFAFHGRASRREYWWGYLFQILVTVVVVAIGAGLDAAIGMAQSDDGPFTSVFTIVIMMVLCVPNLSLGVRRLHDENLRGWWIMLPTLLMLMSFVAIAASIMAMDDSARPQMIGVLGLLCAIALYLLSDIAGVVLMVLPSKPAGARFDKMPRSYCSRLGNVSY
ncbi:DUF805 domain-containing protein [Bifidobacterium oedipodis]|uniref:DUF805 domain-containing protein n=1 Tax=Bifidobacterium oedipodis TaxID=2675322 RepID=A0A7Y0HS26_9BIFI|nr:DUF805 domain-containing protein [Bifidobacterium sp. DSM 109957]NMM93541.1 hypothetical protein [Bifidobacterium sp. DSM 109957]